MIEIVNAKCLAPYVTQLLKNSLTQKVFVEYLLCILNTVLGTCDILVNKTKIVP